MPVEFPEFVRSEEARVEYWSFKLEAYPRFREARPNPAHHALVTLEARGKLALVVGVVLRLRGCWRGDPLRHRRGAGGC